VLWPLAHGSRSMVLAMLFAAEFGSGFGVMVLDISIGAIFGGVAGFTLLLPSPLPRYRLPSEG
jgi:hypothetical protein